MGSQRLSGKVMLDIMGKPMIWHIFNRLKSCKQLSNVVVSTGEYSNNKQICDFALENKIPLYEGSETDLIDRLYKTALQFNADAIVRITADCPLVDPQIIDAMILEYNSKNQQYDIVTNCKIPTYPHGLDAEIYSISTLEKMWNSIKQLEIREWFPFYVDKNPQLFRILYFKNKDDLSKLRWTVDYVEDYEFVKKVYEYLYKENSIFTMNDILNLLKTHPEISEINSKYVGFHNIGAPKA